MIPFMLNRQKTGSVVCPSCGRLVGVNDDRCLNCGRVRPGMFGFAKALRHLGDDLGFVKLVFGGCGVLFVLTLMSDAAGVRPAGGAGGLALLSPSIPSLFRFGASGSYPVLVHGHWWTLLSAGWLHGGILHIAFNLLWIRSLGPMVSEYYGAGRMVIVYVVGGAVGFLTSTLAPLVLPFLSPVMGGGVLTVGASAPICGLLGALVWYGRRVSSAVGRQAWIWVALLAVFGVLWPNVDNWAHLGGFAGGVLCARFLDPMKPERGDHTVIAVLCLALTLVSIVASAVAGVPPELLAPR